MVARHTLTAAQRRSALLAGVLGGLGLSSLGLPVNAWAQWDASASLGAEARYFLQPGRFAGQEDDFQGSLLIEPELRWRSESGAQRISFIPYARLDSLDDERTHVDLREAYWSYQGDDWDLLVGINKVFWGVIESRHLVDIINQTDAVEDPDEEDKLGQPMVNFSLQRDWGRLSAFLLPYFRQRNFPGSDGRLRGPLTVDTEARRFTSGAAADSLDWALRYSHFIGSVDIGAYWFHGNNREPKLELSDDGQSFIPVYDEIDQFGFDLQYTSGAWLWKLESLWRDTPTDNFFAVSAGFEYTLFQWNDTDSDLGLLLEYHHDGRAIGESPTLFDDDLFVGARLALNDVQDTSVLAGVVFDPEKQNSFVNIEAERRLGESYKAELRLRLFAGARPGEFAYFTERDDYLQLRVTRFF